MSAEAATEAEVIIRKIKTTKDYYKVLGIEKSANSSEIKKAYRKLALLLHPDKCTIDGCEDAFKMISSAYKCLSNEDSKKMYDMTGSEGSDASYGNSDFNGVNPHDLFAQMFAQQFNGEARDQSGGPTPFVFHFGSGHPGFSSFAGSNAAPQQPLFELPKPIKNILSIVPWQIVVCILVYFGFALAISIMKILFRIGHFVIAALYVAPKNYRWIIVAVLFSLGMLGIL